MFEEKLKRAVNTFHNTQKKNEEGIRVEYEIEKVWEILFTLGKSIDEGKNDHICLRYLSYALCTIIVISRFPLSRCRRIVYIWGSSEWLKYDSIIENPLEDQFFKILNPENQIDSKENIEEFDNNEGSEVMGSIRQIQIRYEKLSNVGRRYNWQRLNPPEGAKKIVFGDNFCILLTENGKIYKWSESLKTITRTESGVQHENLVHPEFDKDIVFDDEEVVDIEAGEGMFLVLTNKYQVYTWGRNNLSNEGDHRAVKPMLLTSFSKSSIRIIQIAAGATHFAAISDAYNVYTWGEGMNGRLGHGNTIKITIPRKVDDLLEHNIVYTKCGFDNTFFLDEDGTTWGCGSLEHGKLGVAGLSNTHSYIIPKKVGEKNSQFVKIIEIQAGFSHTLALNMNGNLFSFGLDNKGVLGLGKLHTTNFEGIPGIIFEPQFFVPLSIRLEKIDKNNVIELLKQDISHYTGDKPKIQYNII